MNIYTHLDISKSDSAMNEYFSLFFYFLVGVFKKWKKKKKKKKNRHFRSLKCLNTELIWVMR